MKAVLLQRKSQAGGIPMAEFGAEASWRKKD